MRFLLAILVGVGYAVLAWDKPWRRAKGAFYLWYDSTRVIQVGEDRLRERNRACQKCPLFFKPLQTCGTPLRRDRRGCWCYMPRKSRMSSASCWIRDHEPHRVEGWPEGI